MHKFFRFKSVLFERKKLFLGTIEFKRLRRFYEIQENTTLHTTKITITLHTTITYIQQENTNKKAKINWWKKNEEYIYKPLIEV